MQAPAFSVKPTVIPFLNAAAGAVFPIRRAYFVGQNYAAHAKEMGAAPRDKSAGPTEPFYFSKPADCVFFPSNGKLPFPSKTKNYQYEGELVLAIGKNGRDIAPQNAYQYICGYAVGLDMTRRDIQQAAKAAGRPWDFGKAFDYSAPISPIVLLDKPLASNSDIIANKNIWLRVNGVTKQQSNLNDMITDIPHIISFLSQYVELKAGDVIYTGTPEGVSAVVPGDEIEVGVQDVTTLKVRVTGDDGSAAASKL